jgi:hypothetical protein
MRASAVLLSAKLLTLGRMSKLRSGGFTIPLGWICNPAALNIRIFNPKKRITNAYIRCSRIANPTEQGDL